MGSPTIVISGRRGAMVCPLAVSMSWCFQTLSFSEPKSGRFDPSRQTERRNIYKCGPVAGGRNEVNKFRLRTQEFEFGPCGIVFADDLEVFERAQAGLQSSAVEWLVVSRGLGREKVRNGYLSGEMMDETQHRGMYRRWKEHMTWIELEKASR